MLLARAVGVLVASLLLLCSGCASSAGAAAKPSPSPAAHVDTVTAENGTIHPTLAIAGVITPYRQAGIASELSEPIADVDVQEGATVRAGQVLAHLQTDDLQAELASEQRVVAEDVARYAQTAYGTNAVNAQDQAAIRSAQATVHEAQVSLAGASTDLKRYEDLEAQGYLAPQAVDQQRTTVASDMAAVSAAQASLNQAIANAQANGQGNDAGEQQQELQAARAAADAAQASVEQLQRQIARATIRSPLAGVVDAVNANPGEYPSGRELFTIEEIAQVYALLPTATSQVTQIHAGASASVVAAGSTRTDHGNVTAVLDELQPGTTDFTVKVLVPNGDRHLHGGMPVTATVDLAPVTGIEIPVTAFVDDTNASVYAIANGVAHTTNVHEVQTDGTNAIVTGLAAGTVIVRDVDAANVGNGDRVVTGGTHA